MVKSKLVLPSSHPTMQGTTMQPLSLRRNITWTLLGNVLYAGSQWGILTVLAKFGSAAMVGRFALASAICTPIIMLTNIQLRAVQATDAERRYHFSDYLRLRILTSILGFTLIIAVIGIAGYREEVAFVMLVLACSKVVESLSDIIYGYIQQHEQMKLIAISMALKGIGSLIVLFLLVWSTNSLVAGLVGLTGFWLLMLIGFDIIKARQLGATVAPLHSGALWGLAKHALPLGVTMMLASLYTNIPRYFVEHYQGEEALGYLTALSYTTVAGTMVISALGQAASPRLASYYQHGNRYAYWHLMGRLLLGAALIGVAGVAVIGLFGEAILTLLYTADYAQYNYVFLWLAVTAALNYVISVLGYGMTAARFFTVQTPLYAIVVAVLAVASAFLIPSGGLVGAVQATVVAYLCWLAGGVLIMTRVATTASPVVSQD